MVKQEYLKNKFQTRIENVIEANSNAMFKSNLHYLISFINNNPLLNNIFKELSTLETKIPDLEARLDELKISKKGGVKIETDEKLHACFCLYLIIYMLNQNWDIEELAAKLSNKVTPYERFFDFKRNFIFPFCQYIHERILDFNSMLYLLQRYKFYCEWFERDRLYNLYKNDMRHGEESLDKDLRKFIFLEGIDYPLSTPLSDSGRADIVAELGSTNPLVLEIKIFDLDKNYDKSRIRTGFKQVLDYANDYNEAMGYLFIFKACEHDLIFKLEDKSVPNKINIDDKTIFIIYSDIFSYEKTASQRKKIKPYIIEEQYLKSFA